MEEQNFVKEVSVPIFQAKGWLKLLGIVMIIYGAIVALTGFGLIIAWLPIWLGILLFQASGRIETAQITGQKTSLVEALNKIKTYFVINGVLMLIGLIFMAVMIIIFGAGIFGAMSNM